MTAIEITEKIQDGVLKAVETSQAWTLGALRSTSSAFDGIKPDPSLIPFADKVPTATETLDVAFGVLGQAARCAARLPGGMVDIYAPKLRRRRSPRSPRPKRSDRADLHVGRRQRGRARPSPDVAPRPPVAGDVARPFRTHPPGRPDDAYWWNCLS